MNSVIIVAAGSSRRMGFDKIFATLLSKPVLYWSLAAFEHCHDIDEIIIVTRGDRVAEVEELVAAEKFKKVHKVVEGGAERHLSVWNGLRAIQSEGSEFVAIHDAARPLVTPKLISDCIALARKHGAACCASPIPDTVKRASYELLVTDSVDRKNLWAMQTPQVFSSPLIMQAYASLMARHELVTDEVSAVQKLGKRVALLENEDYNFKITFPRDLPMAEQVIEIRTGREKRR
ncbi:MAG: 2-C-methyl-D-erythritol 4-phosphate cytidylyltransferase [Chthoniobacteraceae bacterium]